MTYDEAWAAIRRHFKKNRIMIITIVGCLVLILAGVSVTIWRYYVGLPVMLLGAVGMTLFLRIASRFVVDVDGIYEQYILNEWLSEKFSEVRFGGKGKITPKELKNLPIWDSECGDIYVARAFSAEYNGLKLRAADVSVAEKTELGQKQSKWDYNEPEYVFWGRFFEITGLDITKVSECDNENMKVRICEDKVYLYTNLYNETGAYPVWMQAPDSDDCNIEQLKKDVLDSISVYVEYLSSVAS